MNELFRSFTGDKAIRKGFDSGRPLLLVARNSTQGGQRGRDLAAQELHTAAEALKARLGIDVSPHLPSKAELVSRLRQAPRVKSKQPNGRSFYHQYVHLQLCDGTVHVLIATGSGLKLTDDFEQPFVHELVQTIKGVQPALVFCNIIDRLLRHAMSAGPLLTAMENLNVALADRDRDPFYSDNLMNILTILKASGSQAEAEKIPKQTRDGMVSRTDIEMADGRCAYALAPTPPPGFARLRMRNAADGIGEAVLILDDPACYPKRDDVVVGLPNVTKAGAAVNQVQLVRYVLAHLGKPGHSLAAMGRYLAAHHFSTAGLRKSHGATAHFGDIDLGGADYRPVRAITANLDVYETGEWKVQINAGGYTSYKLTNLWPLDGEPWAAPEDFQRIRKYLDEVSKTGGVARLPLTGVPVTVDGVAGCLRAADERRDPMRRSYGVSGPRGVSRRFLFPALPHEVLADSIVEGLVEAAGHIWIPAEENLVDPHLRHERDRQRTALNRVERLVDALSDQIAELDDEGRPLLTPATRAELSRRQARVIEEELEPARRALHAVEECIAAETRRLDRSSQGVPINLLDRLIGSLRDINDFTYQEWWKKSLQVEFRRKAMQRSGHDGYELTWEGRLSLQQAGERFEVPFSGSYEVGCATKVDERVEAILNQLRQGLPFSEVSIERARDLRREVAERLGLPKHLFVVGNMLDPRILRLAVHVLEHPERTDDEVAQAFGEPAQLVARVRLVVTAQPSGYRWLRHSQPIIKACLQLAHANDGYVNKGDSFQATGGSRWGEVKRAFRLRLPGDSQMESSPGMSLRIPPCPHCKSRRRSLSRLHEPVGFVCLDCRRDQAGIHWPTDPHNKWLEAT